MGLKRMLPTAIHSDRRERSRWSSRLTDIVWGVRLLEERLIVGLGWSSPERGSGAREGAGGGGWLGMIGSPALSNATQPAEAES